MQNTDSPDTPRVLVVDDEEALRLMLRAVLEEHGWEVDEAANGEKALHRVTALEPQVIVLDIRMPGISGLEVLGRLQADYRHIPVIMLTAYGTVDTAVEAMKLGAFDFLAKPSDNEEIISVLDRALEYSRYLRREGPEAQPPVEGSQLVGESAAMRTVFEFIRQVGPSEATILIQGESGTGKELVAEALHAASHRASGPLVKVNCAALPENLLESELFGYAKGAFTGAAKDKPGRFQLAHKGTLFLDEVGEMALPLQAKLLRALQERLIEPLGGVRPQEVDVRVIAATNLHLEQAVEEHRFRQDLYYRLNVLEVRLPPLRERSEDIPLLVGHLLEKLAEKNKRRPPRATPAFLHALQGYTWPGNVRELENVLERALILSTASTLTPEDLPPQILDHSPAGPAEPVAAGGNGISLDAAEKQAIIQALESNGQHRERTAQALGISRRTLQYKLRKYGLTSR